MPIPPNIQTIIDGYTSNLSVRYPPYNLFRLSEGWATSGDADSDTTPNSYIYSNGTEFIVGNFAYSNIPLTTPFDGHDLWYHVFEENETDLEYSVQINALGEVVDISGLVTIFRLSEGDSVSDPGKVCIKPSSATLVYLSGINIIIGNTLYNDEGLSRTFSGGDLYYNVYTRTEQPLNYFIQIDNNGLVLDKINCE
jgi:hypothetical protein